MPPLCPPLCPPCSILLSSYVPHVPSYFLLCPPKVFLKHTLCPSSAPNVPMSSPCPPNVLPMSPMFPHMSHHGPSYVLPMSPPMSPSMSPHVQCFRGHFRGHRGALGGTLGDILTQDCTSQRFDQNPSPTRPTPMSQQLYFLHFMFLWNARSLL